MNLKTFLRQLSPEERERFARDAGTTVDYLKQLSGGHRKASPELSKSLVSASRRRLTLEELRPDIWGI